MSDNGCGISKDDMELVCERHTTSKISKFEDLESVQTFGFRGEALASISHVSHLSIISCKKGQAVAFNATYEDGKMKTNPKPSSGNLGTTITVEDLFYNTTRRKTFGQPSAEYKRILTLVGKYAIKNPTVNFICRNVCSTAFNFVSKKYLI